MSSTTFHDLLSKYMEDPEFREAYVDAQTLSQLRETLVGIRRMQGLSQTDVARRMGVGQSTVSGFETSANDPRISTLQRYARAVCARLDLSVHIPVESAWTGRTVERWAGLVSPREHDVSAASVYLGAETKHGSEAPDSWRAANAKRSDFAIAA